jgi:hypothetical protein
MKQRVDRAESQSTMPETDEAGLVVALLEVLLQDNEPVSRRPIRDKSVGHPDYPSIMPDYTGLA